MKNFELFLAHLDSWTAEWAGGEGEKEEEGRDLFDIGI